MLTARQVAILESIIHFFTETGEEVSSNMIAKQTDVGASSATIRNEMSKLEKSGYIQKTHLSSGRVPSLKGYRFYIDHILKPEQLSVDSISHISQELSTHFQEIDDLIHQSAHVLSELTNYTAIVLGPKVQESRLTDFRLMMINEHQVMAIMETNNRTIKSIVFRPSHHVTRNDIDKLSRILNHDLVEELLPNVYRKMQEEIPFIVRQYMGDVGTLLQSVNNSLKQANQLQMHVSGKNNLFNLTDELSIDQLRNLFDLLENQEHHLSKLFGTTQEGINIRLGNELNDNRFENLSLITANYRVGGYGDGVIAIIGPTYMPYSKTLGVVEGFRSELANVLLNYYIN